MSSMAANPFHKQAARRAERILRSATASRWLARAVFNRSDQLQQRLGEAAGQLKLLARMLLDWATGRYRQVPWATLLTITGALVYFLMPLDAIPDPIIGLGLLDDVGVLAKAWQFARQDIERYQQWRSQQGDLQGGECHDE
ncbi:YkvA family protein [Alcanivorax jadensis]|uniref:YkvA family protein n=1 Tax=Alcanivorax jadensis TaxID=64988 RepID=UPI002409125F|nr:YkvA family protein [Alcanivorax jadensis]MDF1637872.1 YkvA family protein [Alcanivorax jadensis]